MIKKILIVLAIALIVFALVAALQPDEFRVSRSASMTAPPETVFVQVNDFHNWDSWSPWAKLDPHAKMTFSGPSSGVDATSHWAGNKDVGEGEMKIIESKPGELILIQIDFIQPFKATNTVEFNFKPEGDQTLVTWSMYGKNNFVGKAIGLIMNCDKMIGGMYEKGLANLKALVEATPKP